MIVLIHLVQLRYLIIVFLLLLLVIECSKHLSLGICSLNLGWVIQWHSKCSTSGMRLNFCYYIGLLRSFYFCCILLGFIGLLFSLGSNDSRFFFLLSLLLSLLILLVGQLMLLLHHQCSLVLLLLLLHCDHLSLHNLLLLRSHLG